MYNEQTTKYERFKLALHFTKYLKCAYIQYARSRDIYRISQSIWSGPVEHNVPPVIAQNSLSSVLISTSAGVDVVEPGPGEAVVKDFLAISHWRDLV